MTRGIILLTRMASHTVEPSTHSAPEQRTIHWSGSGSTNSFDSDSITTITEYQQGGNHNDEESYGPNEKAQRITIALRTMKEFLFSMDKEQNKVSVPQQQQQLSGTSPPPSPLGMVIQAVVRGGAHAKYPQQPHRHLMCCNEEDDDDENDIYCSQLLQMEGEDPAVNDYDAIFMDAFSDDDNNNNNGNYSLGNSSITMRYEDLVMDAPPEDRPYDIITQASPLAAAARRHDQEVVTTPQGMVIHVPSVMR